jgi:hypothetical protein
MAFLLQNPGVWVYMGLTTRQEAGVFRSLCERLPASLLNLLLVRCSALRSDAKNLQDLGPVTDPSPNARLVRSGKGGVGGAQYQYIKMLQNELAR